MLLPRQQTMQNRPLYDTTPPLVREEEIGFGFDANLKTVDTMRDIAIARSTHPQVREIALGLVHTLPSHAYLDEARAIGDFVQAHVRYVRDAAGMEQLHDPLLLLERIAKGQAQGDCDDMSLLIATLLLSIGGSPLFRVVKYKPAGMSYNHIYVVTYDKNAPRTKKQRLVLDAIVKDKPIGFEITHFEGKEIPV